MDGIANVGLRNKVQTVRTKRMMKARLGTISTGLAARQRQIELGDIVLLLYVLSFVRQCFWQINHNAIAWTLTAIVGLGLWAIYLATRILRPVKYGKSFWLVVGVPLLFAYLVRVAFPDLSFDVLSYHILHAERSLRGSLLNSDDFMHSVPFNSAPDILMGLSRYFLGFRLGTVINLIVLVWAAQITDRILRPIVMDRWYRSVSVLLIMLTESFWFELDTYMVDLLTLPLLLQATLWALELDEIENRQTTFIYVALLTGASAALKLTTIAVGLPLLTVCVYKLVFGKTRLRPGQFLKTALLGSIAFVAPILPFSIYIYRITRNPIFPIANTFFKSPYWPIHGEWDGRWGPVGLWQTLIWPVLIFFNPQRHSELAAYSGRLSVGFVVSIACLLIVFDNSRARTLCLILVSSALLWSAGTGYSRYAMYQELLAGLTIVVAIAVLIAKGPRRKLSVRTGLAFGLFLVLVVQSGLACSYALQKEWGARPTVFDNPRDYLREASFIFRDHSLKSFLSAEDLARFEKVQVWLETAPKSSALEVLVNPNAPILAIRQPEFFVTREALREFIYKVEQQNGHAMFSLCLAADLAEARQAVLQHGLEVSGVTALELPFFSRRNRIGMMLLEIRLPVDAKAREEFDTAWLKGAFSAADYREEIVALNPPKTLKAGAKEDLQLRVKNLGSETWPAVGTKDFRYQINVGNHWIKDGVRNEDNRAVMKADLAPGGETNVTFTLNAPRTPGSYTLEIDMVHEGVTWFRAQGAKPLSIPIAVLP